MKLTYDRTTGALRYDVTTANLGTDRVVALTLQRTDGEKPGAIVAHLLNPNQISGTGTVIMRGRDREDLTSGKLAAHLYTRQSPLGAARQRIELR